MSGNQNVSLRKFKFFRILLPHFSDELPLPSVFTNHFVEESGTWATLLSPLGKSWHVKVHGDDKSIKFSDGWQKFAEDHRLDMGDFLVFKHKGDLIFDVTIFDRSTCERNYDHIATSDLPKHKTPREENNFSKKEHKSERASGCRRRKTTSLHGKRAAEAMESDTKNHESIEVEECRTQWRDHKASTVVNRHGGGPHQFEVVIKKHHCRSYLDLPISFAPSNGLLGIHQFALRDPEGHVWPARIYLRKKCRRIRSMIGSGWRAFCAGNDLREGDSCVFELNGSNELLVQIHRRRGLESMENALKRTSGRGCGSLCKLTEGELKPVVQSQSGQAMVRVKRERDQRVSELSDNCTPSTQFMCTIFPSNLSQEYLNIPKTFLWLVDPPALTQIILVDPKSRRWPVRVGHWRQGTRNRVCLRCGWRAFCMDNNVQVGDSCVFKLGTSEGNHTFHVQVVKSLGTVAQ